MQSIRELDRLLGGHQTPFVLPEHGRDRVRRMTTLGGAVLEAEFGLHWDAEGGLNRSGGKR